MKYNNLQGWLSVYEEKFLIALDAVYSFFLHLSCKK